VEIENHVILVDEASLPLQRAPLPPPRPESRRFVQSLRRGCRLRDAQLHPIESPSASVLNGCLEERTPDARVSRTGEHVHSPHDALVTLFHFGRADQADRANEAGSVEQPENGLRLMVAEEGSNGFEHETHIVLGRGPEGQRLCLEGHPTERDEGGRVRRTQPSNASSRISQDHSQNLQGG